MIDAADVGVIVPTARVSTRSVGEEMSLPFVEPTPAVKKPLAVVRPVSQIGRHCCLGVSKPVPADGNSSSSCSGSTLPSLLSKLKHTSGGISGSSEQGIQCCAVLTGVTVTCAASRPRLSTYRLIAAN